MALIDGRVCIDRWEAALVEILADGSERPWSPFGALPDQMPRLRAVSRPGVYPQGHISGRQAEQACRASGKRLCTAAEWERACAGPRQTTYPYGDRRVPRACNDDVRATHPVPEAARRAGVPSDRIWYEGMDNPLINQLDNTLSKTGERAVCTNEFGTFDMVGNLHEWIEDPTGSFRGGYYMDARRNGRGCQYATIAHSFGYHDYSTGFRCCMAAEPVE